MDRKISLIALILITVHCGLEAQFILSGEMRPRTEYRHGFQTLMPPDADAAFFISQRTRLNAGHRQDQLSVGLSLQDIRVWGEVPQLARTGMNTWLHEAWAELRLSEQAFLKAGRQEIIYDDHRIFGNVDWAQQGRSHDAAILRFAGENGLVLHAGMAYNQESERITGTVYNLNNYKALQYVWVNKKWEIVEGSLLFLNNGWQQGQDNTAFSQTAGGRIVYAPGSFTLSGSVYLQTGRDPASRSMDAWYSASEIILPLTGNISLQAGFELLSGTDQSDMEDPGYNFNHSFNPFYGTNHKFNGHMDYFYVGNHLNNVGLRDLYGGMAFVSGNRSAGFRLHVFSSDALLNAPGAEGGTMPRYLGTEIDIYLGLQVMDQASLRLGYSQMFASESMELLKGGSRKETNNWAWLMLVLKPIFFN
jgi:hypothetical protein